MKETMKYFWPIMAILVLFIGYLVFDGIRDAQYKKEVNEKLDNIASDTNAVYERMDILESDVQRHNEDNGEIVNTLIFSIKDLKDHVDEEVKRIDEHVDKVEQSKKKKEEEQAVYTASSSYNLPTEPGVLNRFNGVNNYDNHTETYYNLPMGGIVANAQANGIPGDYWTREDGVKMYGDKVIVAADYSLHPYGSTIPTSLGEGIVLDTGGFTQWNPTGTDIAVDW